MIDIDYLAMYNGIIPEDIDDSDKDMIKDYLEVGKIYEIIGVFHYGDTIWYKIKCNHIIEYWFESTCFDKDIGKIYNLR